MIYLARREGELFIIKDHWVENLLQEARMMKQMKGIRGVLSLVDSWAVKIRPGVVDVTSQYRSEESHIYMKSIWMHVRSVLNPHGRQLSRFRTKRELVQCLRDILVSKSILLFARSLANMKISSKRSSGKRCPSSRRQSIQYYNRRFGEQYSRNAL